MPDVTVRPLRTGESDAALALWNRSAEHDPLTPALFQEKVWGRPAGLALVAEDAGEAVGLGVGVLWPTAGALRGSVTMLAVAPERRREGVGSALLDALADDLRQRGATVLRVGEAAPNYLQPGIDLRYRAGLAFAEASGFEEIGEAVHLGVDLGSDPGARPGQALWDTAEAEARLAAAGAEARRATLADRAGLGRLLDAHWPAWRAETDRALAHDPPTLHLALRGGDVLGFAAHGANNVGTGWFGPMGTDPAARGFGVGGVLLRRCLRDLREAGHEHATIAWAASLPFYEKTAGAVLSHRFRRVEKRI